jgi:hypothetical protein
LSLGVFLFIGDNAIVNIRFFQFHAFIRGARQAIPLGAVVLAKLVLRGGRSRQFDLEVSVVIASRHDLVEIDVSDDALIFFSMGWPSASPTASPNTAP